MTEEKQSDCLACRITGTATGVGVGTYLIHYAKFRPTTGPAHKILLMTMGTGFIGIGLYRAVM